LSPVDSSTITKSISHIVSTDSVGHFEIDSLVFHGKMKLLFSEVQGKKNKFIQVKLDKDSLGYAFPVELRPLPFKDGGVIALKNKMNIDYADYINERGILLENITIESRQKTSMEKLNQEYSSGLFSGNIYSRNLDLREERYVGDIF